MHSRKGMAQSIEDDYYAAPQPDPRARARSLNMWSTAASVGELCRVRPTSMRKSHSCSAPFQASPMTGARCNHYHAGPRYVNS